MAKRKILILAANPKNSSLRRLDREVRDIEAGMKRSKFREEFEIVIQLALRTGDIQRALLDEQPAIVHFAGQGAGANGLIVEDKDGKAKLVSTQALARLFKFFKDEIECVVLNACYSEEQAEAIREHIGYVLGVDGEITNRQAIQFATGFYDALGAGRSYGDASEMGQIALDMSAPSLSKFSRNLRVVLAVVAGVSFLTVTSRLTGLFEPLGLKAFDTLMTFSRNTTKSDQNIVIVGVSDEDLEGWKQTALSDWRLLKILEAVNVAEPLVIGLDIFRDEVAPADKERADQATDDYETLISYLEQPDNNTISICRRIPERASPGEKPPFTINSENRELISFNDVISDSTSKPNFIRRQLLEIDTDKEKSGCGAAKSLSYQLALRFLEKQEIAKKRDSLNYINMGETVLEPIYPNTGSYSSVEDGGYQIMVNFRITSASFSESQVSAADVLEGDPDTLEKLKNKIVLVGYTSKKENDANTNIDTHMTPIGLVSGVELHAHMVRNIISAVEGEQPLIRTLPTGLNMILVIFWCGVGGNMIWILKPRKVVIMATSATMVMMIGGYWFAFYFGGWWLPLVPSLVGWLASVGGVVAVNRYLMKKDDR